VTATIAGISPEHLHDLRLRAERAHPDEPVASAREVLALAHALRAAAARAVPAEAQVGRARRLAREWIAHPDITVAAAGRLLIRALDGGAA